MIGAVWLAVLAVRSARGGVTAQSIELLVFLWLALLWLGVSLGLGFLLQHYFVPTVCVAIVLSGLADRVERATGLERLAHGGSLTGCIPPPVAGAVSSESGPAPNRCAV